MDQISRQQFINILKSHGIVYFIEPGKNHIIAYNGHDLDGKEYWEDLTNYSFKELKTWLGY